MPQQWPVALAVIWHIYSCLACSSKDSASDLQSSGKVVLGQGQVPCEFQADRPRFSFQGNLSQGTEQPSSPRFTRWCTVGSSRCNLAHLLAPVLLSCEFWADQPGFSFSGEEQRQGSFQPCPSEDGASSMAGSSGHDLAHLLEPVLLLKGWW